MKECPILSIWRGVDRKVRNRFAWPEVGNCLERCHSLLFPGDVLVGSCCSDSTGCIPMGILRVACIQANIVTILVSLVQVIQIVDDYPACRSRLIRACGLTCYP